MSKTKLKFSHKHPSPHHRHEAQTRLIYSLMAVETMNIEEALVQALAAVVKLRDCMSPEQYEQLAKRIEDDGLSRPGDQG